MQSNEPATSMEVENVLSEPNPTSGTFPSKPKFEPLKAHEMSEGRLAKLSGKGGKTKFAIENATRTRIVIADTKIHILGSFSNIKIARDSLCSLILGSPAGKVYSKLRAVTARLAERF
ncbi:unnamed protein product, partial [Vitis vinifera]